MPAASSPACCNRAIRPAISWPRSSTACCFPYIGWRGMFMVGVLPALLVLYIRRNVPESPSWSKEAAIERGSTLGGPEIALAARHLRHRADDRVQFLQPWHPGSLSDLPAGAAQAVAARGRHHRRDLQYRRHLRRHPVRHAVGAFRPAAMHHHRRAAVACR